MRFGSIPVLSAEIGRIVKKPFSSLRLSFSALLFKEPDFTAADSANFAYAVACVCKLSDSEFLKLILSCAGYVQGIQNDAKWDITKEKHKKKCGVETFITLVASFTSSFGFSIELLAPIKKTYKLAIMREAKHYLAWEQSMAAKNTTIMGRGEFVRIVHRLSSHRTGVYK